MAATQASFEFLRLHWNERRIEANAGGIFLEAKYFPCTSHYLTLVPVQLWEYKTGKITTTALKETTGHSQRKKNLQLHLNIPGKNNFAKIFAHSDGVILLSKGNIKQERHVQRFVWFTTKA